MSSNLFHLQGSMDASETMNMFELNGKQIRVGRAMFPPSQIINDGPETHFERTSAAMVKYIISRL